MAFARGLLGSFLVHVTLGSFYCWGNIAPYVTSYLKWHSPEASYATTSWVFSICGFCLGAFMSLGGALHAQLGLRATTLLGGWTLSLGVWLSSWTVQQGLWPFVCTYSVMLGLGVGIAYTAPIKCLMGWLPERKGLATGLVVLGFGSGASMLDPLQAALVNPRNLAPTLIEGGAAYFDWADAEVRVDVLERVPAMFRTLGAMYACAQLVGVLLMVEAPEGQPTTSVAPAKVGLLAADQLEGARGGETDLKQPAAVFRKQYGALEMLRAWQFWLLALNFCVNTQAVFFGASFSKTAGSALIPGGASDSQLTAIAATASFCNGMGRILWGLLSDRGGFRISMLILCFLQSSLLATLPLCVNSTMYGVWSCGIMLCVGGNFTLFPAAMAHYFGERNLGQNYGLLFLAQSLSMLAAPKVAGIFLAAGSIAGLCRADALFVLVGAACAAANRPPSGAA
mmetsp:Transcript_28776/g.95624  ORF Transcript_28776/g.95624 Transcript_28776/m.95624 type:complete len:453 (+) Transcript_28776:163-1521(+)